jgi:hypothetical protein
MRSSLHSTRAVLSTTALGVRRASEMDAHQLFHPSARDVLELRSCVRRWDVPSFARWPLLLRALTHPSVSAWAANALSVPPPRLAAAALAFVGDRAVALALAPRRSETLVGNAGFSVAAVSMGIPDLLRCFTGHQNEPGTLATTYEAVAGAVYLDGGIKATCAFVGKTLLSQSSDIARANMHLGPSVERLRTQIVARHGIGLALEFCADDTATLNVGLTVPANSATSQIEQHLSKQQPTRRVRLTARRTISSGISREAQNQTPVTVAHGYGTSSKAAMLDAVQKSWQVFQEIPPAASNHEKLLDDLRRAKSMAIDIDPHSQSFELPPSIFSSDPRPLAPSRSSEQRNRARFHLEREWRHRGPLSISAVQACLNKGSLGCDISHRVPSADHLCAEITKVVQIIARDLKSLSGLAAYADVGYRLYWLWMSESAYHALPDGAMVELQNQVIEQDKFRTRMAAILGGTKTNPLALGARPCGKLMMFVALGIVYQRFGIGVATAWLQGGHHILSENLRKGIS